MRVSEKLISEKKINYLSMLYMNVKFILFAFSIVSILGFLITYNFLYGYYFSGDVNFKISNFSIISSFIPFDTRTLLMTSFFLICIYYIISGTYFLVKKTEKKTLGIVLIIVSIFFINISLSLFFSTDVTPKSLFYFLLVWIFIGSIFGVTYILLYSIFNYMLLIKGIILTIMFFLMINVFIKDLNSEFKLTVFFVIWLIISCLLICFKRVYFIEYIGGYFKKKYKRKKLNVDESKEKINKLQSNRNVYMIDQYKSPLYKALKFLFFALIQKNNSEKKILIGLVLLISYILIPYLSLTCGKVIRNANDTVELPLVISYVHQNGQKENMYANYFLEDNSILYISNKDWELEVIKPMNYHVRPNENDN